MKIRSLLFGACALFSLNASAQNWVSDSMTMGPGYGNDVFYSLKNGAVKTQPNTDWHLAFQMTPPGPYGNVSALANHVQTTVKVYSLHVRASEKYTILTPADTVGKTGTQLYNSDSSWNYGAFNRENDATNPLDYSWGFYDINSHNVLGDSLYLIKVGSAGTAYKMWIEKFVSTPVDSVQWDFRIAQLDGTGDTTIRIYQKNYPNRLFAYYNVTTKAMSDREPDRNTWDVLATRYVDTASQGPVTLPYNTTGILSNFGVTVADAHAANADTAHYTNYTAIKALNAVGYDWKVYDMSTQPGVYRTDSTLSYFIKSANTQEYYQLQFTRFDGSTTGKIVFRKRLVAATSVHNIAAQALTAWSVSPNPANNNVSVMVDAKEAISDAQIMMMDAAGKVVMQSSAALQKGMNGFSVSTASVPSGLYFVRIGNGSWSVAQRLVVAH